MENIVNQNQHVKLLHDLLISMSLNMRRTPMIEVSVTEMLVLRSVGREKYIIWGFSMILLMGADKISEVTW